MSMVDLCFVLISLRFLELLTLALLAIVLCNIWPRLIRSQKETLETGVAEIREEHIGTPDANPRPPAECRYRDEPPF